MLRNICQEDEIREGTGIEKKQAQTRKWMTRSILTTPGFVQQY